MVVGPTPVDGSATPLPMASVVSDGVATPNMLEGGPTFTDANGNLLAPVAIYAKDGNIISIGTRSDAAATDNTSSWSVINLLKALYGFLSTLAGAVTSGIMQHNTAQISGTAVSVNAGTIGAGTQRIVNGGAATGVKTVVGGSITSGTILAANTARKGALIYNDSTATLYLDLSGGTAASTSFSVAIAPQGFFELPGPTIYNGLITGIWSAAAGNARVTEFS